MRSPHLVHISCHVTAALSFFFRRCCRPAISGSPGSCSKWFSKVGCLDGLLFCNVGPMRCSMLRSPWPPALVVHNGTSTQHSRLFWGFHGTRWDRKNGTEPKLQHIASSRVSQRVLNTLEGFMLETRGLATYCNASPLQLVPSHPTRLASILKCSVKLPFCTPQEC